MVLLSVERITEGDDSRRDRTAKYERSVVNLFNYYETDARRVRCLVLSVASAEQGCKFYFYGEGKYMLKYKFIYLIKEVSNIKYGGITNGRFLFKTLVLLRKDNRHGR